MYAEAKKLFLFNFYVIVNASLWHGREATLRARLKEFCYLKVLEPGNALPVVLCCGVLELHLLADASCLLQGAGRHTEAFYK